LIKWCGTTPLFTPLVVPFLDKFLIMPALVGFDYEIQVNQNTVVGKAVKVERQPTTLFTVEDSVEIKNFNPTRRIKLGESKPVTWPTNAGIIRNLSKKGTTDGEKSGVVPHHLINLYNEAAAGRTTGEQEEILHLLQKYSHAFSVND
jgi:hypothetical protein